MEHKDQPRDLQLQPLLEENQEKNNNEKTKDSLRYKIFVATLYCLPWAAIVGLVAWAGVSIDERWKARPNKARILDEHDRIMQEFLWSPGESLPGSMDAHADTRDFAHLFREWIYDCSKEQVSKNYRQIKIKNIKIITMQSVVICYKKIESSLHHNSNLVRNLRWVAGGIYQDHRHLVTTVLEKEWGNHPSIKPAECAMDVLTEHLQAERKKIKLSSASAGANITIGHFGWGGQGSATFAQETVVGVGLKECPEIGWEREGNNKSITFGPDGASDLINFLKN